YSATSPQLKRAIATMGCACVVKNKILTARARRDSSLRGRRVLDVGATSLVAAAGRYPQLEALVSAPRTNGIVERGIELPPVARQPLAIELTELLRCVLGDERQALGDASPLVDLRAACIRIDRHDRGPARRLLRGTDRHGDGSVLAVDVDLGFPP